MNRPTPPAELLESLWHTLRPAIGVWDWVQSEILADTGSNHSAKMDWSPRISLGSRCRGFPAGAS